MPRLVHLRLALLSWHSTAIPSTGNIGHAASILTAKAAHASHRIASTTAATVTTPSPSSREADMSCRLKLHPISAARDVARLWTLHEPAGEDAAPPTRLRPKARRTSPMLLPS